MGGSAGECGGQQTQSAQAAGAPAKQRQINEDALQNQTSKFRHRTRTRVARVPGASRAASAPRTARTAKASACQCGRLTAAAAASVCCRGAEATPGCVKPPVGFEPTTSRLLTKLKRHLGDAPQCSSPMFLHIAAFVSAVLRVASLKQARAVHRRPAQRKAGMSHSTGPMHQPG